MLLWPPKHRQEPLHSGIYWARHLLPPFPCIFTVFSDRNVLFGKLCNALFPSFLSKRYLSKYFCCKINLIPIFFLLSRSYDK